MFYETVATLVAGFAGAGLVLVVNKSLRGRLPKWATPVGAGLAMLIATIANEYSWYDRTVGGLPEGLDVIAQEENRAAFRPWTYAAPFVDRFVAVDTLSLRTHPAQADLRMVDTLFLGRWAAPQKLTVLLDCKGGRRAQLTPAVTVAADGTVTGADWVEAAGDDPLLAHSCQTEAAS
ncbi:hypothetical protein [Aliiroseovarius crassostreae]|uniref:hypothetical protein n=1 Tax=Aliiroseovarius crassostreae TaxID=154981 RepID=UPI003C7CF150